MAQTITWSDGDYANTSIYLFSDDVVVEIGSDKTAIKDSDGNTTMLISDVNSDNATLHTGVTTPDDYFGYKYTYTNNDWTAVEGWVDPRIEQEV
tara:strand:- start:1219 stop:1500 length:282 start_codon:yes stop_codon:yes gene_type:complete